MCVFSSYFIIVYCVCQAAVYPCYSADLVSSCTVFVFAFDIKTDIKQKAPGDNPSTPANTMSYDILILPSKLLIASFFLLSVASAYMFIVVVISLCPIISCITLILVSFSQNRVQNV